MARSWRRTRDTFRHGHLPDALVAAAIERLESGGIEALSLRELARDAGVNHRAVYRHFPNKLSLLARVAQEGWRRLKLRVANEMRGKKPGADTLVAGGLGIFRFARDNPNLFHFMAGPRMNMEGAFADLDAAIADALQPFSQGFADAGTAPKLLRRRTAVLIAALTGVIVQMLHKRIHVAPTKARKFIFDTCKALVEGLRSS
jgi:AcrR family transcriptional regulator